MNIYLNMNKKEAVKKKDRIRKFQTLWLDDDIFKG